jgi:hypothetical protein
MINAFCSVAYDANLKSKAEHQHVWVTEGSWFISSQAQISHLQNFQNGPRTHPDFSSIETDGSFPEVKRLGRKALHLPPSSVKWSITLRLP